MTSTARIGPHTANTHMQINKVVPFLERSSSRLTQRLLTHKASRIDTKTARAQKNQPKSSSHSTNFG